MKEFLGLFLTFTCRKKMDFVILFHCIRKYNQRFDIEEGLRQTEVFGVDVVDAVLNGANYVRSLKDYLILANAIEKLKWEAFLEHNDLHEFSEFAKSLKEFQIALASKNSEERKNSYHIYLSQCQVIKQEFETFPRHIPIGIRNM